MSGEVIQFQKLFHFTSFRSKINFCGDLRWLAGVSETPKVDINHHYQKFDIGAGAAKCSLSALSVGNFIGFVVSVANAFFGIAATFLKKKNEKMKGFSKNTHSAV